MVASSCFPLDDLSIQHLLNNVKHLIKKNINIFKLMIDDVYHLLDALCPLCYSENSRKERVVLSMERKIKTAAEYAEKSQAQLARDIDMTPSNFNQKLKRGTFTEEEFADMAKAMGAEFICKFRFPDGTEI